MEMGYLKGEWRRFQRVIPDPRIPLAAQVENAAWVGEVIVRDISEGGIELEAQTAAPSWRGELIRLRLQLPDGTSILASGRICHVEANRLGVVFEEMLAADRERIRQYVATALKEGLWVRLRRLMHAS
jgi:c-di-GMP-binding flagellar brake protein YcgR